ncbi:hypothetical protein ASPVEDRAFT_47894 [Aspergillus versicolor CBS 583.65]|uniref:Uncharacterized protein n=1 Tax=Aspergillus versicolor CBS 583.65 TaxID=1036611 RepID=A0A1L9Q4M8_ASPVE|nr:uncharacterized protein ASPVEDRAFT_47894 [Aspergillus versicolor CBS 583.65]OJJ08717.1 hypothetical protein ASPVEDRAFT_47894 [Aspergillus versicolor CBS 583.65]
MIQRLGIATASSCAPARNLFSAARVQSQVWRLCLDADQDKSLRPLVSPQMQVFSSGSATKKGNTYS